ncbi:MAG: hypothetical protein ACAH88_17830, partial [Roseimicrobium sp.]
WLHPMDFRVFTEKEKEVDAQQLLAARIKGPYPEQYSDTCAQASECRLVIVLIARATSPAVEMLVDDCCALVRETSNVAVMLISLVGDHGPDISKASASERLKSFGLKDLDEKSLRPDLLNLHALDLSLQLVAGLNGGTPEKKKPRLFLSHAKQDGVPLARTISAWLKLRNIHLFYDTKDLRNVGSASEKDLDAILAKAVSGSIVIALRSEVFDSRYWCQKEVFWAEKHRVPVLVVDARWNIAQRPALIGLDCSPSVRIPDGSITRILLAALKEGLRMALLEARVKLALKQVKEERPDWVVLPRYPSLVSLTSASDVFAECKVNNRKKFIVYPNPAMPALLENCARNAAVKLCEGSHLCSLDEFRLWCATGDITTRPLEGKIIALSIAGCEDFERLGFDQKQVNQFVLDFARRIIALGGTVALNHKWRPGGVMDALSRFVVEYKELSAGSDQNKPYVINYLAAPDMPALSESDKAKLQGGIEISTWDDSKNACEPHVWNAVSQGLDSDLKARAGSFFACRRALAEKCDVRMVIGGSVKRKKGRAGELASGTLEETVLTLHAGKPVLFSTALGGMADEIAGLLKKESKWRYEASPAYSEPTNEYFQLLDELAGKLQEGRNYGTTSELGVVGIICELLELMKAK